MMAKPFAFSPVWAKYSSNTTVQLIRSPSWVEVPESPILFLNAENKWAVDGSRARILYP
jgi:hypothetical protein